MAEKVSRRRIARVIAARIVDGEPISAILRDTAAYLIDVNRQNEYELLVRDIEDALANLGHIVADVTVARSSTQDYTSAIQALRGDASKIYIREHIDPTQLGGIKIALPDERYDATLRTRLDNITQLTA